MTMRKYQDPYVEELMLKGKRIKLWVKVPKKCTERNMKKIVM